MNRKRTISVGLAALAVAALGGGAAQAMPASAANTANAANPAAAPRSAPRYVVLDCAYKPVTKPADWTPYCADYGVDLQHFHWTSWTGRLASGYGTVDEDDNYPSHADGKIYTVPALVTLWGSAKVKGHPCDRTYTEMTLIFPGQRPAVYERVNGRWTATYPVTQTLGFL